MTGPQPSWRHTSGTLTSPLPTRSAPPPEGRVWRSLTWISPGLREPSEQRQLTNDLLWLGLMLGLGALWCLSTNLHAGHGPNALIVTLGALSALTLCGGWALDRMAVRRALRPRR